MTTLGAEPLVASTASPAKSSDKPFEFPKSHSFPPLYTIQPNPLTRTSQFQKWSRIIQLYCQYHRIFRLQLPGVFEQPLFKNRAIRKALAPQDGVQILNWMATAQGDGAGGGERGAWIVKNELFWVFWKKPEEWADLVYRWVESVGQKGAVLTIYELLHGEAAAGQEFHDMDEDLFSKALTILVKRGKARVFGEEESQGVKFF